MESRTPDRRDISFGLGLGETPAGALSIRAAFPFSDLSLRRLENGPDAKTENGEPKNTVARLSEGDRRGKPVRKIRNAGACPKTGSRIRFPSHRLPPPTQRATIPPMLVLRRPNAVPSRRTQPIRSRQAGRTGRFVLLSPASVPSQRHRKREIGSDAYSPESRRALGRVTFRCARKDPTCAPTSHDKVAESARAF